MLLFVSTLQALLLLSIYINIIGYITIYFPFICSWIFKLFPNDLVIKIVCLHAFTSIGYLSMKGPDYILGLCWTFKEKSQMVFQSGCNILHSHSDSSFWTTCSLALCQVSIILVDMYWYHIVILTCISLMTNDVEHPLRCLFSIYISFLVMCLFESFAHCFIQWFVLSYKNFFFLYSRYKSSIRYMFRKYFFYSVGLFSLPPPSLIVFYEEQKF